MNMLKRSFKRTRTVAPSVIIVLFALSVIVAPPGQTKSIKDENILFSSASTVGNGLRVSQTTSEAEILASREPLGVERYRKLLSAVPGKAFSAGLVASRDDNGRRLADWCVTPSLPGPCSHYPARRQKTRLSDVIVEAYSGQSVHIYPGTYTDMPDVSVANLVITGVRGPSVTIFDGLDSSEAALKVSAGGVVLDGFTFTHSGDGDGGGVDAAGSPNIICDFLDRELPTDPVIPACSRALSGGFTLKNSRASGNWSPDTCDGDTPRCYGVKVIATGRVTISNVEASKNGSGKSCTGHGYQLTKGRGPDGESCFGVMAFSTESDVVLKDIVANNNRAKDTCYRHETCFGVMADETAGNVTMEKVTANGNGADKNCSGDDVCFGIAADGVQGKVTMKYVEAKFNGAKKSCVTASDTYGPIPLNDSCAGIIVDGEDWSRGLSIYGAVASNNGAFGGNCGDTDSETRDSCLGLIIDGRGGDIVLSDIKANDNRATGDCQGNDMCAGIVHDPSDVVGVFSLTKVQANRNGAKLDCKGRDSCFGILHDTGFCSGNVKLSEVEASYNGAGRDCPATDSCQGIVIDSGDNTGTFKFEYVKANSNGAGRDCGAADNCNGILIDGGGVTHDPADPQDLDGFCSVITPRIRSFFVSLKDIEANANGAGGDCLNFPDQCTGILVDGVLGPITMEEITAIANKARGNCLGPNSCNGVVASSDGGTVRLKDIEAKRNGANGMCIAASSCIDVVQ